MADGSFEIVNVGSVKRHQAIHNNAVHTPATPVNFIHQFIQFSEIPVIFMSTTKRKNRHARVSIQCVSGGIIHSSGERCLCSFALI
jgi:hypothetical protein